jgi:hypothetical protein
MTIISLILRGRVNNRCDHHAIDLRVRADVEHGAPAICESDFFIERYGPRVSLPYAKPQMFAIQCASGVMDRVHESLRNPAPMRRAIDIKSV